MGNRCLLLACLVFIVMAQGVGIAQSQPFKYLQPPKLDLSYDFSSELKTDWIMADDWLCADGLPVTDIHWWGSYWTPLAGNEYTVYSDNRANADNGGIEQFIIAIFSDVAVNDPDNNLGFSHPGEMLAFYEIAGDCNETFYDKVVKSTNPDGSPKVYEDIYEYSVDLTNTDFGAFEQEQGNIYWLAVVADLPDESRQWGWHESSIHWNDYAVQGMSYEVFDWYIPCGGHDMAFGLTTVPEPGSLFALGTGILGLAGTIIRRIRR